MRTRYIIETYTREKVPEIDAFLADIVAVCRRHGMAISHEDGHGAFEIVNLNESNLDWLDAAHDARFLGRVRKE